MTSQVVATDYYHGVEVHHLLVHCTPECYGCLLGWSGILQHYVEKYRSLYQNYGLVEQITHVSHALIPHIISSSSSAKAISP